MNTLPANPDLDQVIEQIQSWPNHIPIDESVQPVCESQASSSVPDKSPQASNLAPDEDPLFKDSLYPRTGEYGIQDSFGQSSQRKCSN